MSVVRPALKLAAFGAYTLPLMPLQWLALMASGSLSRGLPVAYHRGLCRLLRLDVVRRGEPVAEGPVLLVANHASWLDIPILSSLSPVVFIAKHEVADWPFFGTLARLQRTIFVERRRSQARNQRNHISERLKSGERLILFAEGTSSDGNRVLPFKSSLFAAAEHHIDGRPVKVQPVSVAYTHLDGIPLGRQFRHYYAWYGAMELMPHFWRVLQLGNARIEVFCHPPVTIEDFGGRKELAQYCHAVVQAGMAEALTGHRGRKATEKRAALAAAQGT